VPNVPPLRFPEFSGEYEKHSLGEMGNGIIGLTYSPRDVVEIGGTIVFRSSNIQNGEIDYSDLVRVNMNIRENIITRKGDLLICARNGSPKLIGKNALLTEDEAGQTFGAFMLVYRSSNNPYIHKLLNTKRYVSQVKENLGARINQITTANLNDFEFYFPTNNEESKKVADFIGLLDKRISTQIRVIEDLQTLKKAIRKQMLSELLLDNDPNLQIKDVLEYEQPTKYLVSNTEYSDDVTLIPVLTANKAFILGYTDDINGIYSKGKCIILDDFTLDCKLVDFPFKVKSSAIKILTAKRGANIRYLYEYLKFLDLGTSEHKRHYIAEIEPLEIVMPDINIANNIANALELMDKRINLAENMLIQYRQQKQYLLQKMFI
jgi:type I restriction enzyme S subunit